MQSVILPFIPVKVMVLGSRAVVKDVTPPNVSAAHFRTSESLSVIGAICVCGSAPVGWKNIIEVPFVTCKMDGNKFAFRIRYKIAIQYKSMSGELTSASTCRPGTRRTVLLADKAENNTTWNDDIQIFHSNICTAV